MRNHGGFLLVLLLAGQGTGCIYEPESSVRVLENPFFRVSDGPRVIARGLNQPAAPRSVGGETIFAEGGKGTINRLDSQRVVPLIEGFGVDNYFGYDISVLGVEILPERQIWLVAAAEAEGKLYVFDAQNLPRNARAGREIKFDNATPLNPFDVVLVGEGPTLVASGGTSKAYQAPFPALELHPLRPVLEVETGLAGLALDSRTGLVYGAVIGSGQGDGAIIRWDPEATVIEPETVAGGFHNLLDVLITDDGLLLALELGPFGADQAGRVVIVDDEGQVLPFIVGLDAPSGFHLDEAGTLLITTLGRPGSSDGTLLSLTLNSR